MEVLRIAIAGAGLSGLTLAASLRRSPHRVTVFEKRAGHTTQGWGLGLDTSTGLAALEALAIDATPFSTPIRSMSVRAAHGEILQHLAMPSEPPTLRGVQRAPLHRALLDQVPSAWIRWGVGVADVRPSGDTVRIGCTDGSVHDVDLLVGADGLRSQVRAAVVGDALQPLGVHATAGRTQAMKPTDHSELLVGDGSWFWMPISAQGERIWSHGTTAPPDANIETWARERSRAVSAELAAVVAASLEVSTRPLFDRDPIEATGIPSVVLIGDAAHPMSPFRGKGGNLALLDAVELGATLTGPQDWHPDLGIQMEARFQTRAAPIQVESRKACADLHR